MKMHNILVLIYFIFFCYSSVQSQEFKSVLGLPDKFAKATEKQGIEMDEYMNGISGPKSKNKVWRVICDREGMETFSDPNGSSKSGKKLKFKDWFYVMEEKGSYIHLGKMNGEPDNNLNIPKGSFVESHGWVEKSKMLLWTSGLRSAATGISLKSLILYTAEGAKRVIGNPDQAVKIYKGPGTYWGESSSIGLYEYYFVLKKENGFYLLSKDSDLLNFNNITGWVSASEQADWNTRLALEPNFDQKAFDERKMRVPYQFVAFTDEVAASSHASSGSGSSSKILTKDDPVNAHKQVLGTRNSRRYIGKKLRMPVLRCGSDFYATGVLGSVGQKVENECPECEKALEEVIAGKDNYNILFLVEANTSMRQFKSSLIDGIESLKRELTDGFNQKFGIAFYRNASTSKESYLDITPLTKDIEVLKKKIESTVFTDDSYDGFTALYNALSKSVSKAGFQANSTNIIYVIGQNPDFRENPNLKLQCIENGCSSWVQTDKLVAQLSNIRAHLVFIQPSRNETDTDNPLSDQAMDIMLEVSKDNYTSYRKINQLVKKDDTNPNPVEGGEDDAKSYIAGGSTKNVFYYPKSSGTMSSAEFSSNIRTPFKEIKNKLNDVYAILEDLMQNPDLPDVPGDGFEKGALFDLLREVLKKSGMEPTEDNLNKILDRKVPLYVRAYVPKKIHGASFDLCSQVLFFPEKELADYMNDLRSMVALKDQPEDQLRTGLKNVMLSIYNKYTGNKKIDKGITIEQFFGVLHGECFILNENKHMFAVNSIDNPRVKIEQLRNFLDDLQKTYENLELLTKDNSYEFKFITRGRLGQNTYYWIPIEDTF